MIHRQTVMSIVLVFALNGSISASTLALNEYPELDIFIEHMASHYSFAPVQLRRTFEQAKIQPSIIQAMERPKEALPWGEYKKIFVTEEHIRAGREYWIRHRDALVRAEREHGVPPEIIVAIIGVETRYGRQRGNYRVLDALTTLVLHYPPRAQFFKNELEQFLLLTRELKLDPLHVTGSYAGAIGIPQFIPSSYRRYAIDFNNDKKRDLMTNDVDAIGSVANFLKMHGWEEHGPIVDDAQLESASSLWLEQLGIKPLLSLSQFISYGVFPRSYDSAPDAANNTPEPKTPDSSRAAALIVLEGDAGPIPRLGYNNFYVITRYNRSTRYAMAIYELSQMIRKRYRNDA